MSDISDIVKISVACTAMIACAPETANAVFYYVNKAKDFFTGQKQISNELYIK